NAELRFTYAELLAQGGKKDEALKQLKQVESSDPQVLSASAELFGKLQAYAECVAALDKAIGAGDVPALHVRRGICRHGMKDDAGAQKDFQKSIEMDPKFAAGHYYLGQAYA